MKKSTVKFKHLAAFFDTMAHTSGDTRYRALGQDPEEMAYCTDWTIEIKSLPYHGEQFVEIEVTTTLNS